MSVGVNRTIDLIQPERTRRVALRPELPAVVAAVMPGSLSDEIGIEPGDRIIEVNGQPLRDVLDFHFYAADEEVTLVVERGHGASLGRTTDRPGVRRATRRACRPSRPRA